MTCLYGSSALISAESFLYYHHRKHNQECFTLSQDVMAWSFIDNLQRVPLGFSEYDKFHHYLVSWDPLYFNLLLAFWRSDTVQLSSLCEKASVLDIPQGNWPWVYLKSALVLILIQTKTQRIVHDSLCRLKRAGGTLCCGGKEKWNTRMWIMHYTHMALLQSWKVNGIVLMLPLLPIGAVIGYELVSQSQCAEWFSVWKQSTKWRLSMHVMCFVSW